MEKHRTIQEQDVLKTAIRALGALTGATVKVLGTEVVEAHRPFQIDALVQMTFRSGKQQFYVEVKSSSPFSQSPLRGPFYFRPLRRSSKLGGSDPAK